MLLALIIIIGIPVLAAMIVVMHTHRLKKESWQLDNALFRKEDDLHE